MLLKVSPLRGPTAVILQAPHPGLHRAEGHRMDPTHLGDLSDREAAGIAQRQVTAQLLGMHLEADAAPCRGGPATTASTTPSLHAAGGDPGSNPSVHCPLRDSCPSMEPFYNCGKRQICVLQLFYISNYSTSRFAYIYLLLAES